MRSDFMLAINQLCAERKLSVDVVLEAVEAALISAYKRNFGATTNVEVKIEPNSGEVRVYTAKDVVEDIQDDKTEITLADARQVRSDAQIGETVLIESTPRDFGRIAAQTAKQVILQRIREAERDALYSSFADSAGEIAHGTIQSIDYHSGDVIVNLDGAEALLPSREQVPGERYRRGTRLRAYVTEVRRGSRGPQITLSRRSPALLRRLLELEVPEIFSGTVEIKGITREAGSRSKVAVHATQDGVDPVGSCVGVRGGRIQNVVNELGGEKIDVVQWNADLASFIANSLSPAKVMNVLLDDNRETGKTATVIVPDRQLSLAIGKEGQNARLAAKLTGWRIDIKSATEAAEETLGRLEDAVIPPEDMDLLSLAEAILRKRGAGDFTDDEIALIEAEVSVPDGAEPPAQEPKEAAAAPASVAPETEVEPQEPEAEAEPEEPVQEAEAEEPQPVAEEAPALLAEEEEPATAIRFREEESELEPPFEGEPIEDSIGWVRSESELDYYIGWEEESEEDEDEDEDEEEEWVREDFEEREDPSKKSSKKKKKKKGQRSRSRSSRSFDSWK
jgi:transcription termination/antitermination protein NusA